MILEADACEQASMAAELNMDYVSASPDLLFLLDVLDRELQHLPKNMSRPGYKALEGGHASSLCSASLVPVVKVTAVQWRVAETIVPFTGEAAGVCFTRTKSDRQAAPPGQLGCLWQ